ncbi:MAG: enoyl-CoA hydratase/isomerase family protein [Deltaproteobacteria bacterium]|nr:enoyl-CoA hydratase/isomerase family protein [Deltaproteobacteria bacterium]
MNRIGKAAVLGSGVMGATIAAHLANAGFPVLLLDLVPENLTESEKSGGLALTDPKVRNRIAAAGLEGLRKMRPSPFYRPEYVSYIETGNFEDDARRLAECDWVIEAVIENMDIKKRLLAGTVVPHLRDGAILSTNTSGLSANEMAEILPAPIRKNFLVTHFFNPPRFMRLVEIVSTRHTEPGVAAFMADFIERRLGKGVVQAKDTPNFIANRIGVYSMYNAMRHMVDMGMTVEEVDAVAGSATARPGSGIFGTADLVGIDTLIHVGNNSFSLLSEDEERDVFRIPFFLQEMANKGLLGNKSKQGFYKKVKGEKGDSKHYYDYISGKYDECRRPTFPSVGAAKACGDPAKRLAAVVAGRDKGAEFAWRTLRDTLIYAFRRIPEIADDIASVDDAMKWGFNWDIGPFEMLDAIGVSEFVRRTEREGFKVPGKLKSVERFYEERHGKACRLDLAGGRYAEVRRPQDAVNLSILKKSGGLVDGIPGASVVDLGDGVFCLEFHTRMNAIDDGILSMTGKAIRRAEEEGVGLVIANQGRVFSAGADLANLAGMIMKGAYKSIDRMVKNFQTTVMELKYSGVPVVAAPHGSALGGGCEICLHSDAINPHAETYMGLVEIGVGLLPAGGGTKEMAIRAIRRAEEGETDVSPFIAKNFMNIAMAKVSSSAAELYPMGFLRHGDAITMNLDRRISDAKRKVLALSCNYRPSRPLTGLKAPGRSVGATLKAQLWNMKMGGFVTEYEEHLGGVVAGVITGGDVPAGTPITEEYLLDLERDAFVALCGRKETLERIEHMLKKGKALRN